MRFSSVVSFALAVALVQLPLVLGISLRGHTDGDFVGESEDMGNCLSHPDLKVSKEELELDKKARATCGATASGGAKLENGVITYLVTRQCDVRWLRDEIFPQLWTHWLQHHPYPVVIFVASKALREYDPESFQASPEPAALRAALTGGAAGLPADYNLTVAEFDVKCPESLGWHRGWKSPAVGWHNSYFHMNTFFTKAMYEHEILSKYRYYVRLDTDLKFVGNVTTDPFCLMRELGRKFMFQERRFEKYAFNEGLPEWFADYASRKGLQPKDAAMWADGQPGCKAGTIYKGYVGLGDLDFFRSKQVRELSDAFNQDGRIYTARWSDQTYYVQALALLEPHSAIGNTGIDLPVCHKCGLQCGRREGR